MIEPVKSTTYSIHFVLIGTHGNLWNSALFNWHSRCVCWLFALFCLSIAFRWKIDFEIRDCYCFDVSQRKLIYWNETLGIYYENESNSRMYSIRSSLSHLYKKYKDGNLILRHNFLWLGRKTMWCKSFSSSNKWRIQVIAEHSCWESMKVGLFFLYWFWINATNFLFYSRVMHCQQGRGKDSSIQSCLAPILTLRHKTFCKPSK